MTIIAAGCNHVTTPLSVLERTTLDADRLPKVLHMLRQSEHISEVVVLSTCNRTEVYALVERFHGAAADIRDALAEVSLLAPEDIADYLDILHDEAAASHLFSVAAGLDSAVVGEAEILGQVRAAWESARAEGVIGPSLELLFRHAIECGKAARTQTDISRGTVSVSSAAVQLATARLDTLADKAVLLLGAGEMAEGMAHALAQAGVARMAVINRTWERAVALAQAVEQNGVEGQAVPVDTLADQLERVDLVLSGTGAAGTLVDTDEIAPIATQRAGRPLLIVDVAVPRNVDPSVGTLDGVTLLDMEDIEAFAQAGLDSRKAEVASVKELVHREVGRYSDVATAREVAPLVVALRDRSEAVRAAEMAKILDRLDGLDPNHRDAVEQATRAIVAKLLHQPTVRLKGAAGSPRGDRLADALRDLFEL